ncbi:hypothetical protein I546_3688 [Mycobacterium kansasii 732]|nr:hypothetical protein I546_3688 [Mycobacterium kansasii 732]
MIPADGSREAGLFDRAIDALSKSNRAGNRVHGSQPDRDTGENGRGRQQPTGLGPRTASNPSPLNKITITSAINRLIGRDVVVARW